MLSTPFINEHLIPGIIGKISIVCSFIFSFICLLTYLINVVNSNKKNVITSRLIYIFHNICLLISIFCLLYIFYKDYFEYYYVWSHSSKYMPIYYKISSIWEGQEGSFLLWILWESILGFIIIIFFKKWENYLMMFVMLSQCCLLSMLLGINIYNIKIGLSPFELTRIIKFHDIKLDYNYLCNISDGQGLNILLKNYWMIIHPPILFGGYATMIMPFIFSIIGLIKNEYYISTKISIMWSLISALMLGLGIIMGSMWAYESLNFGGYWSWDPVENVSLISWIINITSLHILIIFSKRKKAHLLSIILCAMSFLSVLYASFMTKSGLLSDSSVHSFVNNGLSIQLIIHILIFILIIIFTIVKYRNNIVYTNEEDNILSKEFWIIIGSLIMLLSALQIFISTLNPIWNIIFKMNIAPPDDPIKFFNTMQLPMISIILLLCGLTQLINYNNIKILTFIKKLLLIIFITTSILFLFLYNKNTITNVSYIVLGFSSTFVLISNIIYLLYNCNYGSSISHIGFSIMIIGILISGSQKQVISTNNTKIDYGDKFNFKETKENTLLFTNKEIFMNSYKVTYIDSYNEDNKTFYKINFQDKNNYEFNLYPYSITNKDMYSITSFPSIYRSILKDIYTYISMIPYQENKYQNNSYIFNINIKESYLHNNYLITLNDLKYGNINNIYLKDNDISIKMNFDIKINNINYNATPSILIRDNNIFEIPYKIKKLNLIIYAKPLKDNMFQVKLLEQQNNYPNWIVLKIIIFPFISLFWIGAILILIGFLMSIIAKINLLKKQYHLY